MNGATTRKEIGSPGRESERGGEGGNGYDQSPSRLPAPLAMGVEPTGKVLVEGYRKDMLNGFEGEKPLYNPVRTRSCTPPRGILI